MKKLLLLLLALVIGGCFTTVSAQYVQNPQTVNSLKYSHGGYKTDQGIKLSKDELRSVFSDEQFNSYIKAKHKYRKGQILSLCGVGLVATGVLSWTAIISSGGANEEGAWIPSCCCWVSGIACTVIGVPKAINGKRRLKIIGKEYNSAQLSSSFGIQQNGVGFAFNF